MTGSMYGLLAILLLIAIACTWLRRRAVKWLFTVLAIIFWVAFLGLLGFVIGYRAGDIGIHLTHLLF